MKTPPVLEEPAIPLEEEELDAVTGGAASATKPVAPRRVPPPSISGDVQEGTGI